MKKHIMKKDILSSKTLFSAIIYLSILLLNNQVFAQQSIASNSAKERLYIHLNKNLYIPGEIAWFNIYSYDIYSQKPFHGDHRVAYLDLVNADGRKVMETRVVLSHEAQFGGSLYLPGNLSSGDYWLVTYTTPSSSLDVSKHPLKIVNPMEPAFRAALSPVKPTVVLHPEGGNLVLEKPNRVAYYTRGLHIEQFPFTLFVEAEDGAEVFEFESNVSGAGVLDFTPRAGKDYKAYVRFKDGSLLDVTLPNAVSELPTLKVDKGSDINSYKVTTFWNGILPGSLKLEIRQFGQLLESRDLNTSGTSDVREVALNSNLKGGVWFEVWHNGQKVASRLVFKGAPQSLNSSITFPSSNQLASRNEANIKLNISAIGQPATLSVSLYRKPEIEVHAANYYNLIVDRWLAANGVSDDGGVIAERMWFTDDKEWEVDNPYLIAQRSETVKVLDYKPVEHAYQSVSFEIKNKQNRPIANEYFFLTIPGKTERVYLSRTDQNGVALFHVDPIFGKQNVVISSSTGLSFDAKMVNQHLEDYAFLANSRKETAAGGISEQLEDWIGEYSIAVQSENAYFRKERANFDSTAMHYRAPFYGIPDRVYRLDDYTRFVLMEEVLKEYMPEVMVLRRNNTYQFRVHNQKTNLFFDQNPLVLLDGVPVLDLSRIINYDPRKVEEIAIITSTFYYGPLAFPGVVSFKTYKGDMKDYEMENHAVMMELDGYQLPRQFFTPNHTATPDAVDAAGNPIRLADRIPDLRNVLYWNNQLQVNGKEDVTISVVSSDLKGTYIIEVEGLDKQGRVIKGRSELKIR